MTSFAATFTFLAAVVAPSWPEEPLRELPQGFEPRSIPLVCAYGYRAPDRPGQPDIPIVLCADTYEALPAGARENALFITETLLLLGGPEL